MVKTITKVGNSQGLIFDSALLEMARLKVGDEVNIEVHEGGTITVTPVRPRPSPEAIKAAVEDIMDRYSETLKKLS
jgi:antitoxin component of MazEF toxin-antitoxin module